MPVTSRRRPVNQISEALSRRCPRMPHRWRGHTCTPRRRLRYPADRSARNARAGARSHTYRLRGRKCSWSCSFRPFVPMSDRTHASRQPCPDGLISLLRGGLGRCYPGDSWIGERGWRKVAGAVPSRRRAGHHTQGPHGDRSGGAERPRERSATVLLSRLRQDRHHRSSQPPTRRPLTRRTRRRHARVGRQIDVPGRLCGHVAARVG